MIRPSPPRLEIPHVSPTASSVNSPSAHTGRPPMWTKSAQRKLARLYLYTTLPLEKILTVVHIRSADGPGLDSGNKRLNSLLDKEPRWLRPKSPEEMALRINQLKSSTKRSPPHDIATLIGLKQENVPSPSFLYTPVSTPSQYGQRQQPPVNPAWPVLGAGGNSIQRNVNPTEDRIFSPFLRRDTIMSTSTDDTTGSYHQVLDDWSESYIKVVKRLVKSFTFSRGQQAERLSLSPASDNISPIQRWLDDDDCPPRYDGVPYPLPGDFLAESDQFNKQPCEPDSYNHVMKRCLCHLNRDEDESPWVTEAGLTPRGQRLLGWRPQPDDSVRRDAFDNTALHFIAARGTIDLLIRAVQSGQFAPLLHQRNTADQTFLHLLRWRRDVTVDSVHRLLNYLFEQGFDIFARDNYGRNVFHVLKADGLAPGLMALIVQPWKHNQSLYNRRDAFCSFPTAQSNNDYDASHDPDSMELDPSPSLFTVMASSVPRLEEETALLRGIGDENPRYEDEQGRNALHCLAMAKLSMPAVMEKFNIGNDAISTLTYRNRKDAIYQKDSSKQRLQFRRQLLEGLLARNVDVNHYSQAGNTPLMAFAAELPENGDYKIGPSILKLLVERGANVHARNAAGETALHVAARCGRKLAIRALVESGANVNVRDAGGRSVLDVIDLKMMNSRDDNPRTYAHYEACRAWLSGNTGRAVQDPSVLDEWQSMM